MPNLKTWTNSDYMANDPMHSDFENAGDIQVWFLMSPVDFEPHFELDQDAGWKLPEFWAGLSEFNNCCHEFKSICSTSKQTGSNPCVPADSFLKRNH